MPLSIPGDNAREQIEQRNNGNHRNDHANNNLPLHVQTFRLQRPQINPIDRHFVFLTRSKAENVRKILSRIRPSLFGDVALQSRFLNRFLGSVPNVGVIA